MTTVFIKNVAIILVGPQLGENIGAVARAMKNFGFYDLRIVNPRDGWPNDKAISASVGAVDIINNASIYTRLEDAVADLNTIYATTAQCRFLNKDYVLVKNLRVEVDSVEGGVGILFGRENCGLTNEEVTLAHKIITIDTDPSFSSLNIAQAVLVVCYELFHHITRSDLKNTQKLATEQEKQYLYEHLISKLEEKNFFKVEEKKAQMSNNIINIFSKVYKFSKNEVQTLRGIIATLTK
jgi:tRNA/rRNA methyltransferase